MSKMFNPPHPGRIVKSVMESLGLSARKFAANLGVSPATVTRLVKGENAISREMAVKLSVAIPGPDAAMWLRMQATYDAWQAEQRIDVSHIQRYSFNETAAQDLLNQDS